MAKGKRLTALVSTVLTFLAVFGGLGCLATGMELRFDTAMLVWGCVLMALLFSLFWDSRLWLLPLCLSALLLVYWWQEDTLRLSMESLLYQISDLYDRGYGWGILQWSDRTLLPRDVTEALLALGLPIAAAVSFTVAKGRHSWLGAFGALIPLLFCILLTDTVPAETYLALLLSSVILMLMTGHVRCHSHRQANTLSLTLALPLTLALALMFTFCPREGYHMQSGAQKLEDLVLQLLEQTQSPEDIVLIPGDQARTVNLANTGKRSQNGDVVMTVRAEETGSIYLRGCAYDIYDGTSWSSTPGWNSWNLFYTASQESQAKTLSIRTKRPHSVLYFTYTPQGAPQKVLGGRMRNEERLTEYTVSYIDPVRYNSTWSSQESQIGGQQLSEYLQLPDSTREAARKILTHRVGIPTETTNAAQVWENATYIANWVSRRADYDLRTGKMPAGQEDFALWFLEEADTGYCTHFATAATVLLRAAGIPAQYVTGYLVDAKAGQEVAVTDADAHAWVEVFINGIGWVMLEPTPAQGITGTGGSEDATQPSRPTTPNQTTEPEQTAPTTEPEQTAPTTEPEQTTEGTVTHRPDQTTQTPIHLATTAPGIGGADPQSPGRQRFGEALLWLLSAVCFLLALVLQWRIRVAYKQHKCRQGHHNRRALQLWKQLSRACKLNRAEPPEECYWLAQKARFSQHTITAQELHSLKLALNEALTVLRKHHFLRQMLYTIILAVY